MCALRDRESKPAEAEIQVAVLNRQRKHRVPVNELLAFARALGPLVLSVARNKIPEEVLVVLVSDRKISAIHQQFMGIADPTDVITFQHGEIVVSVETAARQATEFGTDLLDELRLYIAHGLLHLAGYDDHSGEGFTEMARMQNELVAKVVRGDVPEGLKDLARGFKPGV
jgi:probable rRNA maturation factor